MRTCCSTIGSLSLSSVDVLLHFCVGLWLQFSFEDDKPSEASYVWLAIIFALIANLLSIVVYVAKNVDSAPPDVGQPVESELQKKLSERPEESVGLLMLGMIDTEFLCFLTGDDRSHMRFRQLALVSQMVQGIPLTFLFMGILYSQNWSFLLCLSFFVKITNLLVGPIAEA